MMNARPDIDWQTVLKEFDEAEGDDAEAASPKDPTAAERMRRYRKRQKEKQNKSGDVTRDVTPPAEDRNEPQMRLVG